MAALSRRRIACLIALLLTANLAAAAGAAGYVQVKEITQAAGRGDLAAVTAMLEAGIHVDSQNSDAGTTALMAAAAGGHLPMVQALLAAGANVDKRASGGWTALLHATTKGHVDVVRTLLAAKANPDFTSPTLGGGRTPLMWALSNNSVEMAGVLLDGGANVHATTSYGATPLRFAVWHDNPMQHQLVKRLLDAGADPDAGYAPSYKRPANPPMRSAEGTALGDVAGIASAQLVQVLLAGGAGVDARQPGWRTPLMLAAAKGNIAVVRLLLAAGADVDAKDSEGKSALDHSREGGHSEISALLGGAAATPGKSAARP